MSTTHDSSAISVPQGGGAQRALGEKFVPDLHTGTGNLSVPIELPPGRHGLAPRLALSYSSGQGNGAFGLGWALAVPGVARRTAKRVPRYDDSDVFVLSGAEDLVPVDGGPAGAQRYRPRTESAFAQIDRIQSARDDYWRVRSRDGLESVYGTPGTRDADPAAIADGTRVFAWRLTRTTDPFGNHVAYRYARDERRAEGPHRWDQLYLSDIRYADYGDPTDPRYMVHVRFVYEPRPDPFSDYRAGFEVRTVQRCRRIEVWTDDGTPRLSRTVSLRYADELEAAAANGLSLLAEVTVTGHDGDSEPESLPALRFGYSRFSPEERRFKRLSARGSAMPERSLADPNLDIVDLFGNGLPDVVALEEPVRYWRNLGNGTLDRPRTMRNVPGRVALQDAGVMLADLDGDGRSDLLVAAANGAAAGYYPLSFDGEWDERGWVRFANAPTVDIDARDVRLLDLDGDGGADIVRAGASVELYYNRGRSGWDEVRPRDRGGPGGFPDVTFEDERVKIADMTGDGLPDIVLIRSGRIDYWPNLGHGRWADRVTMAGSPRFDEAGHVGGFDPRLVMLVDVDGDGVCDLVHVASARTTAWINRAGNEWGPPIVVRGTPPVDDPSAVRPADVEGTGTAGILWTYDAARYADSSYKFLDLTGGRKPYLLTEVDNGIGARTTVEYESSTRHYLRDQGDAATRWRAPLPFPVQVVGRVEVSDAIAGGRLVTRYRYHHGYWDGAEREFRGFGRVDQLDAETFDDASADGSFSPPIETRTWFHQGAVDDRLGDLQEADHVGEYWAEDGERLPRPPELQAWLDGLPRAARRDALRALRGRAIRSELYDERDLASGSARPFKVTEHLHGVTTLPLGEDAPKQERVFFPHTIAERTTQWERGEDPMSRYTFTGDHDAYGQPRSEIAVAVPRGTDPDEGGTQRYLVTQTVTERALPVDPGRHFIVDRVARSTTYEIENDGRMTVAQLVTLAGDPSRRRLVGQTVSFYDGDAFTGRDLGEIGSYGAQVRTESLVMTDAVLREGYRSGPGAADPPELPPYLDPSGATPGEGYPADFRAPAALAGYSYPVPDGAPSCERGYWAAAERRRYDFHHDSSGAVRGLALARRDPLGRDIRSTYDPYDLLPQSTIDPVGLETRAENDYRILKHRQVTDPNGNRTRCTFTPLGLLASVAVMGKDGEAVGDTAAPGSVYAYDFTAFRRNGQPISARMVRHVHHRNSTVPDPAPDDTIEQVEYSDGFGRLIQTRSQAEDAIFGRPPQGNRVHPRGDSGLPVDQSAAPERAEVRTRDSAHPTVRVSAWTVYDNKGRAVQSYEPFFDLGWSYRRPTAAERGESTRTHYDARGEVVRTVYPDGSEQRLVRGIPVDLADPERYRPSPWELYTYDANDNAGRTHRRASAAYGQHWNTPASVVVDAIGRVVIAIERLGSRPAAGWHATRTRYDIRGNVLSVTDPLGRRVLECAYDLANRRLRVESLDAGIERTIFDAAGRPLEHRTSTGALALRRFDPLGRVQRVWARDRGAEDVTLRERVEYGDGSDPNQPRPDRESARAANTLGCAVLHFDEAGRVFRSYDFKGNVRAEGRRAIADERILEVFGNASPDWKIATYRVDWRPPPGTSFADHAKALLEPAEHTTSMVYDALNRVTAMQYPKDATGVRRKLDVAYNRAGVRERLVLDGKPFVRRIAYNARGQRILVVCDNGLMTRHAYDAKTFRLARTRTEKFEGAGDRPPYAGTGLPLQDLAYRYDLVGNIRSIDDRTSGAGVEGTPNGRDRLLRELEYDPLYRLTAASGRECTNIASPPPWGDAATCGFGAFDHGSVNQGNAPTLTRGYVERYDYDAAGNLLRLAHQPAGPGGWTRRFGLGGMKPADWDAAWRAHLDPNVDWTGAPGNRLTHVGDVQTHTFDADGSLIRQGTSSHYEWDWAGRMRSFRVQPQAAGSEPSEDRWSEPSRFTHYLYDSAGQRVKKLTRNQGGQHETVLYVGAAFEAHRFRDGKRGTTLSVMDGDRRVGTRRLGNAHPADRSPELKYQLDDHLGSSVLVVDQGGAWVNREEHSPYGETTFGGFAKKRYRFTGKERDEESGLYYHGARYYAPWLCRWTSPDAADSADGLNRYAYVRSNPLSRTDPDGRQSSEFDRAAESPEGPSTSGVQDQVDDLSERQHLKHNVEQGLREIAPAAESIISATPVIGVLPSLWEASTGKSLIRGEKLSGGERLASLPGAPEAAGHVLLQGLGLKRVSRFTSEEIAEHIDDASAVRRTGATHERTVQRLAANDGLKLLGRFRAWRAQRHANELAKSLDEADSAAGIGFRDRSIWQPHHVVAVNEPLAERARNVLARFDIDIDSALNGAWLPNRAADVPGDPAIRHRWIHTSVYFEEVNLRLERAATEGADAVRVALATIKHEIHWGTFPH